MEVAGTVIQVGEGRGFVIAAEHTRYVVPAAHCAGERPISHAAAVAREVTYENFIRPLGGSRDEWAECVFLDRVADIAVFSGPDGHDLYRQAEAYEKLTEQATPFPIGKLSWTCPAFVESVFDFTLPALRTEAG
jgi:hypothetical protein